MEAKWTREWPTKPGRYWFYGWPYGKSPLSNPEPELNFVEAVILGSGKSASLAYVRNGHFYSKREGGDGMFMPMEVPKEFPELS